MGMEIIMDLQILYKEDKPRYVSVIDKFELMKRIAGEGVSFTSSKQIEMCKRIPCLRHRPLLCFTKRIFST